VVLCARFTDVDSKPNQSMGGLFLLAVDAIFVKRVFQLGFEELGDFWSLRRVT
jgi:hypothetical protein